MRVAVLGAGGIIAPAIVRDLAESEEVEHLKLLDIDEARARATGEAHAPDAQVARVDPDGGLGYLLTGVDVLVNSASYRVNLDAMRACLESGCHYIDLGGLYHLTTRQLELDDDFTTVGKLALLGMGSSPGKTNVMGVRAVEELGTTPELMDVYAAGRDLDPPDGPSYPYSPRTLVDELTEPPMALRDGEPVALEPMQDGGSYPFPEPIGQGDSIYTLHSEVRTFGDSFGCDDCSFRLSLAPAVLERVKGLVGAEEEAIAAAAAEAVPSSGKTVSVHVVTARSDGRLVTVTAKTQGMEDWGIGGGIVSTAAPAAAAVRLLARGDIDAVGAMPPERCVRPEHLFPELERRNCTFDIETTEAT
ncbi:MAG TPA: saccharopine dehydrogenase NADP-binding domain-containing protein [Thermoleophilaceae bacterium]|nr:saccharopine dehydrogenase NADP-binding domain-containing protein [Thermoleophilaceae bacterium]